MGGSLQVNMPHAAGTTTPVPPTSLINFRISFKSAMPLSLLSSIKSPIQPRQPPQAEEILSPEDLAASFTSCTWSVSTLPSISKQSKPISLINANFSFKSAGKKSLSCVPNIIIHLFHIFPLQVTGHETYNSAKPEGMCPRGNYSLKVMPSLMLSSGCWSTYLQKPSADSSKGITG